MSRSIPFAITLWQLGASGNAKETGKKNYGTTPKRETPLPATH